MTTNMRYITARMLMGSPTRPNVKGPAGGAVPVIRRSAKKVMGGIYEIHNAMACSETIALKAVDEPI